MKKYIYTSKVSKNKNLTHTHTITIATFSRELFILIFMLLVQNFKISAQCNQSNQTICSINNVITLNSPGTINYTYDWYIENCPACPNNVPCMTASYVGTGTTFTDYFQNGSNIVYYVAMDLANQPVCTSQFTLLINPLIIQSNNVNNTLGSILSVNMPCLGFTSYQWYRNGDIIVGETNQSIVTQLPGNYVCDAYLNPCGLMTSNAITITCQPTNTIQFTNYVENAGTHVYTGNIYIDGFFKVPEGSDVSFINANITVANCGEIIVDKVIGPISPTGIGGRLLIENSSISGCESMWRGIKVIGEGYLPQGMFNIKSATLTLRNSKIYDAAVGVKVESHGYLYGDRCLFENNLTHIYLETCWEMDGYIKNSKFSYLKKFTHFICFDNYNSLTFIPQKHFFANYISSFTLENDTFIGQALNGNFSENAIEVHSIQSPPSFAYRNGFEVTNCNFFGNFDYGVNIKTPNYVVIKNTSNTSFNGDINHAIKFDETGGHNLISGLNIVNPNLTALESGISIRNSFSTIIENSNIIDYNKGIEVYIPDGSIQDAVEVRNNNILASNYGVTIATREFPVSTIPTLNQLNLIKNVLIHCNRILNCNYGIIGTGLMIEQGDGTNDWSNRFCTSVSNDECLNVSSSNIADVVWLNDGQNYPTGFTLNYDKDNKGSLIKRDLKDLGVGQTLYLDGVPVTLAGANKNSLQFAAIPFTNPFSFLCPSTHYDKKGDDKEYIIKSKQKDIIVSNQLIVYPNPASISIRIEGLSDAVLNYKIYDITGRLINEGYTTPNSFEIPVKQFSDGLYNIVIYSAEGLPIITRFLKN